MNGLARRIRAKRVPAHRNVSSHSDCPLFLVGQNSRGNWVIQDQDGLCGGLFIGRAQALKFALSENGNRPERVIQVAGVLELDMTASPRWTSLRNVRPGAHRQVA